MADTSGRPGKLTAIPSAPVTAAELDQALEHLLAAKKDACDVLERAMGEVPRPPGITAADAIAALGKERARLTRALLHHMRITYDPAADAA